MGESARQIEDVIGLLKVRGRRLIGLTLKWITELGLGLRGPVHAQPSCPRIELPSHANIRLVHSSAMRDPMASSQSVMPERTAKFLGD